MKKTTLFCGLVLLQAGIFPAFARNFYLDPAATTGRESGEDASPWKSWARAQESLQPGDTLYCSGELGIIRMKAGDPVGTRDRPIRYSQWEGKPRASVRSLIFDGSGRDVYLIFNGLTFDPGYVDNADFTTNVAVNLDGSRHVAFDRCHFEGPKLAGGTGDFSPYCVNSVVANPPTLTAGNPANASHVTIENSRFGYSSVAIRIAEDPRTGKSAREWVIRDNDFEEAAEDFILLAGGSQSLVSGNRFSKQTAPRSPYDWPGTASGDWNGRQFAPVTQDGTGASGIFYRMTRNGRFMILADSREHLPTRNSTGVWRLDADPRGVFFTPSGTGDNTHTDIIALMGAGARDITIENNYMEVGMHGAQALKIDAHGGSPENNVIQNNIMLGVDRVDQAYLVIFEGGKNCLVRHNLIWAMDRNGSLCVRVNEIKTIGEQKILLSGNIIGALVKSRGTVETDHNCFMRQPVDVALDPTDIVVHGVEGVGMEDSKNRIFALKRGSVCIDKGNPSPEPGKGGKYCRQGFDYSGKPRDPLPDIGPFEFAASAGR